VVMLSWIDWLDFYEEEMVMKIRLTIIYIYIYMLYEEMMNFVTFCWMSVITPGIIENF